MPNFPRSWHATRRSCAAALLSLLAVAAIAARADAANGTTAEALRGIVTAGRLADLKWPDFTDYQSDLQSFYEAGGYAPAWTRDGQPTAPARELIGILREADNKGLDAEDYDASRWDGRLQRLDQPDAAARFDAALSVCLMRYVSDLHVGRINPDHFKFKLATRNSSVDLPQFLRQLAVGGSDLRAQLELVEPPFPGYRRTQEALRRYLGYAHQDAGAPLPVPAKAVDPGSSYAGVTRLTQLLRQLGDLPADATVPAGELYQEPLVTAVKRFQERHGLTADGRLGAQTVRHLNVPLAARVEQLQLTLERWRWLPHEFPQPPVVVNIPEFRLRTFGAGGREVLSMNVIVGKALRHETPVFDKDMRYVVFRPYWNVPSSIQRSEIVPAVQRDRSYIARKNYEVTTHGGQFVTDGPISDEVLEQLRAGKLAVRQKPGPATRSAWSS